MEDHPKPVAPPTAKPVATPRPAVKPESLGSWADPTDVADRYAMEQARREAEGERPPHY
ncbi:MAG: hypothetical protein JWM90_2031 [Thermoleophilia bacterium]|nr:hypothetical protein [Thermoleophilia bacterium]